MTNGAPTRRSVYGTTKGHKATAKSTAGGSGSASPILAMSAPHTSANLTTG